MREIKFKLWDKRRNAWVKNSKGITIPIGRMNEYAEERGWVLVEFTNLKDKNGVEIYEGNIVRYNTGEVWVVKWSSRFAAFIYENKANKNLSSHEQTMDMHEVEVIGTVHENPELLKSETQETL